MLARVSSEAWSDAAVGETLRFDAALLTPWMPARVDGRQASRATVAAGARALLAARGAVGPADGFGALLGGGVPAFPLQGTRDRVLALGGACDAAMRAAPQQKPPKDERTAAARRSGHGMPRPVKAGILTPVEPRPRGRNADPPGGFSSAGGSGRPASASSTPSSQPLTSDTANALSRARSHTPQPRAGCSRLSSAVSCTA